MKLKEYNAILKYNNGYWFIEIEGFKGNVDMGDSMQELEEYEELLSNAENKTNKQNIFKC